MISLLAAILVLAGIGILVAALIPIRQLMKQLPPGQIRNRWRVLTILIAGFIIGYLSYVLIFWNQQTELADFIVPIVFFFGACFVWVTTTLSLQTAMDVRRVSLLEYENITDPLMGIYNRRYMERRLQSEIARAQRYTLPLSVLLLDIDHFKNVNDCYGHQAGDLVLSYLGKLTLNAIRESDIATRYGGEELLVIAPNTTLSAATTQAERLRLYIESHEFVLASEASGLQAIRTTVSIGVASLDSETNNIEKLLAVADAALYRAKQEGRNCVIAGNTKVSKSVPVHDTYRAINA